MDKLNYYRQCLREFLTQYANYGSEDQNMETQLIFDTENDHYLLLRTGWDKKCRIHSCIFHYNNIKILRSLHILCQLLNKDLL